MAPRSGKNKRIAISTIALVMPPVCDSEVASDPIHVFVAAAMRLCAAADAADSTLDAKWRLCQHSAAASGSISINSRHTEHLDSFRSVASIGLVQ